MAPLRLETLWLKECLCSVAWESYVTRPGLWLGKFRDRALQCYVRLGDRPSCVGYKWFSGRLWILKLYLSSKIVKKKKIFKSISNKATYLLFNNKLAQCTIQTLISLLVSSEFVTGNYKINYVRRRNVNYTNISTYFNRGFVIFSKLNNSRIYIFSRMYCKERLLRLCILCVHIETSSLWAEFVNKNRCISVRLVSKEDKSI